MKRRCLSICLVLLPLLLGCSSNDKNSAVEVDLTSYESISLENLKKDPTKLYVAVSTMISPLETFNLYKDLIDHISEEIGIPIEFKQRKTYDEVNDLLKEQKIDFAFICTGAYWKARKEFPIELLAVPVINGSPTYNAYVIVNKNSNITDFADLKDKSFAFTDPSSNSGYAYVVNILKENGLQSDQFFSRTMFTYAHDYSIQAVARNLVDGATIDGLVWDYLEAFQPEKIASTKIIQISPDFGIPPFVVRPSLDPVIKEKLRNALLNLHQNPKGLEILSKIFIERFEEGQEKRYEF